MCDYCGCPPIGPTAKLAAEREHLQTVETCCTQPFTTVSTPPTCSTSPSASSRCTPPRRTRSVRARSTPFSDQTDALCREHDDLHRWLADVLTGPRLPDALRLLVTHIDNEKYDIFPTSSTPSAPSSGTTSNSRTDPSKPSGTPTEHQETS